MLISSVLKNNIICDDPSVKFNRGDFIYVKGDVLFSALRTLEFYHTLTEWTLFQIIFNSNENQYIKMKLLDQRYKDSMNINGTDITGRAYLIMNYGGGGNKMPTGIIEIKTKI